PAPESSAFYENWQGPFRCPIDRRGGRHPPSCPKNRGSAPVAPPPPAPTPLLLLDELQKTPYVWTRLVPDRWADVATTRRPAARAHRWASRGRTSGQVTAQGGRVGGRSGAPVERSTMTDHTSTPASPGLSRRTMLAGAAAAMFAAPVTATALAQPAAALAQPATRTTPSSTEGTVHRITMYVEELGDGQVGYGLEPGKATIPGPVLEMYEGDTMEITLVNTTDRDVSIHPHGVLY